MESKRVLFVSQEIHPYLPENTISSTTLALAKKTNDSGHQVRVFMPRFGVINERRHQLHEVIRLSGMNVVINDMDMPLIIKVASVPGARMQVYFIDNEEYFKRKFTYADADGKQFEDNDEDKDVCGPETRELVKQSINSDAFGGDEAVKERLVEHEAKRQKQDPQSAEGARRQDPQNQQEVQDMPGSGSDAHPYELEPTAIELKC